VADDRLGLQPARRDQVKQRTHVRLHVAPPGAKRERFEPHLQYGKSPITALGTPTIEMVPPPRTLSIAVSTAGEKTHALDARVGADPAGLTLDRLDRVNVLGVDWDAAEVQGHLEPRVDHVDDEHAKTARRAALPLSPSGQLARRRPPRPRPWLDLGPFGAEEAGGKMSPTKMACSSLMPLGMSSIE